MTQADEIAAHIGFYYYEKAVGNSEAERINAASRSVHMLDIFAISCEENNVVIYLSQPGILIGKGGENINALTEYIKKTCKFFTGNIKIEEIKRPQALYCFRSEYDYDRRMMEYL